MARRFGRSELADNWRKVNESALFDEKWYLNTYPDVATLPIDPLMHYLLYGGYEGREPNPSFDSQRYLSTHHGAQRSGVNPLLDYVLSQRID